MSEIKELFKVMEGKFNKDAADGIDLVFQFDIDDTDDVFYVAITDSTCDIQEGSHDSPSVTLMMTLDTLSGLMDGSTDGMQAFMAGQLRAEGDMMLATKLGEIFPN